MPGRLTGTRTAHGARGCGHSLGRDLGGWAGGCRAEQCGCLLGAEGFVLLSGGVAGQLGFGGKCPSPKRPIFGVHIPPCTQQASRVGVPLTPLCFPPAVKPPKTFGGALGALGFRGERCHQVTPCTAGAGSCTPCPSPSHPSRGSGDAGGAHTVYPPPQAAWAAHKGSTAGGSGSNHSPSPMTS